MKKIDFTIENVEKIMQNKYAATIIIANRAKGIRENIGDQDDEMRKFKPPVAALKEFLANKLKFPEFNIKKINEED